jgi:hypothetical protein
MNNVVVAVSKGQYRIPQFQREYVWKKSKVIELFDSIYKEYPIGSFFLWKAGREHNQLFRHSVDLDIRPIQADDNIAFILDGQQRITSLYVTLKGLTISETDYSRICFDVKEEKFTHREPDDKRFIRVCDIWEKNILKIATGVDPQYQDAIGRCYEILRTYPVSIVEVSNQDLPAVCKIFQRINQSGKRLDRFDLISAMTFSPDFDLREKFRQDVLAKLKQKSFGEISPAIVTQLMALIKKGACTENAEYSLSTEDIKEIWKQSVDSVLLAADTLRKSVGVQNANYLPYDALLTLLAYYYASTGQRALDDKQLKWVQQWFWRASFSQHYGSGGATKIGRDKELFDQLAKGSYPPFEPAMNLTAEILVGTKMTWTRSAVRNAFLCMLAYRNPVHLINNSKLDLINGGISDFTSTEKHHIFPQGFLRDHGTGEAEIHALPNFCFLPAELNKRILDTRPSEYFPELRRENSQYKEAARTHLLPLSEDSGIEQDDYLQFLKIRSELILQEVERLTGLSTAPSEDQRQKAVERLETQLRDLIHSTLADGYGLEYWKMAIPEDVRTGVAGRIEAALRKNPDIKPEDYVSPREKLNFCNMGDYSKIILIKSNWPRFEPVFHRRIDLERHMEAFSEFRNALMHNRPLTEIGLRAGELAILWFGTVLPHQNAPDTNGEEGDGNE